MSLKISKETSREIKMKNYQVLKSHCSMIFFTGAGSYWYEDNAIGNDKSFLYRLYSTILLSTYTFMTILEIMAAVIGDLPPDDKSNSITLSISHTIIMIKTFSIMLKKDFIKSLNKNVVKVCEMYENPMLMTKKYRIIKLNVRLYFMVVYGTITSWLVEGARKHFTGSHFITVVTYYPFYEDNSISATSFRVFTTIVQIFMMATMISVDTFGVLHLIIFKYKVITLRHYFEGLREEFDRSNKSDTKSTSTKLTNGLIEGIVMHGELLR